MLRFGSQNQFDNLFRKYTTYCDGAKLFGITVTQHPQLMKIRTELTLLQKLYGLYNNVIETVNGYNDILWTNINIEKINNELLDFQTRLEFMNNFVKHVEKNRNKKGAKKQKTVKKETILKISCSRMSISKNVFKNDSSNLVNLCFLT